MRTGVRRLKGRATRRGGAPASHARQWMVTATARNRRRASRGVSTSSPRRPLAAPVRAAPRAVSSRGVAHRRHRGFAQVRPADVHAASPRATRGEETHLQPAAASSPPLATQNQHPLDAVPNTFHRAFKSPRHRACAPGTRGAHAGLHAGKQSVPPSTSFTGTPPMAWTRTPRLARQPGTPAGAWTLPSPFRPARGETRPATRVCSRDLRLREPTTTRCTASAGARPGTQQHDALPVVATCPRSPP